MDKKWNDASKILPPREGQYLAYRPRFYQDFGGQITVCYWNGTDWIDNYDNNETQALPSYDVSHWMDLPKKP